ncbi:hypothetical protein [Paracoccus sp. IB05]|uniref:hypothetical protein n=1 Tax=Paracoccus sp. IB05 TaxID=2779367 RepID=UPI0018E73D49|nr:hypothetical protein [Paracoccus sp. IB05]MBJ2150649.1 hypothetical protein [Paracoccus sp. IB05]
MSAVDLLTVADALDRWAEVVRADRPIDASITGLRQMARVVRDALEPASRAEMIAAAALARHSAACDGGHSLVGTAAAEAAVDAIIALGRRAPVSAGKVKALVWRPDGMAASIVGQYVVWDAISKTGWRLSVPSAQLNVTCCATEAEAKAAAQADYEARILSQFEPGDGWQGIESAKPPKDRPFLARNPGFAAFIAEWSDIDQDYIHDSGVDGWICLYFSHWMEIPELSPASLPQGEETR